jgi:hypothetical protein
LATLRLTSQQKQYYTDTIAEIPKRWPILRKYRNDGPYLLVGPELMVNWMKD